MTTHREVWLGRDHRRAGHGDLAKIDTACKGRVFNVALSDMPERKADLIAGRYELPAPKGPTGVAVKITDMLGEEVLVMAEIS